MRLAPRLSVIIPAYQAVLTIDATLASVVRQDLEAVEVLVVDDGSSDGTRNRLARWLKRDSRLRVLKHWGGTNRGVAASRNLGIREARAPLVAFLDADDLWLPHTASLLLAAFAKHPEAGFVYGQAVSLGDHQVQRLGRGISDRAVWMFGQLARFNVLITSATAARRPSLPDPPFPEGLPFQFEDWACWLRTARTARFVFLPKVLAQHRIHAESAMALIMSAAAEARFELEQGRFLRGLLPELSPREREQARLGLRFRAGEALRCAASAARRGHIRLALAWATSALAILDRPVELPRVVAAATRAHRRAVLGTPPPLTVEPPGLGS